MAIIEMPKDATGRWIPLDTKVLYNDRGVEYEVNRFTFGFDVITREGEWTAESYGTGDMVYRLPVNSMHLERPDSLKQLMEDLNRVRDAHDERGKKYHETPVDYIQCQGKRCIECRLHNHKEGETCFDAMMDDIVSRVNRLYIDSNYLAGDSERLSCRGTPKAEIPLDTKILYNEDGKCFKVDRFTYSVVQTMPGLKWGVVFMDCRYDYCSSFYLTSPETPDSWEKLEEDFDRCIEESNSCWYFSPGGGCFKCARPDSDTCGCTASVFKDIKRRIRRLRGEN